MNASTSQAARRATWHPRCCAATQRTRTWPMYTALESWPTKCCLERCRTTICLPTILPSCTTSAAGQEQGHESPRPSPLSFSQLSRVAGTTRRLHGRRLCKSLRRFKRFSTQQHQYRPNHVVRVCSPMAANRSRIDKTASTVSGATGIGSNPAETRHVVGTPSVASNMANAICRSASALSKQKLRFSDNKCGTSRSVRRMCGTMSMERRLPVEVGGVVVCFGFHISVSWKRTGYEPAMLRCAINEQDERTARKRC